MDANRDRLFVTADGQRVWFTFALMTTLFALWGFCNGMIDTMDKHFQDELGLSKAQSATVQFAHFAGYALMAWPASRLAEKLGYKGGIITGLLLVAIGGFWFVPATWISNLARAGRVSEAVAFTAFLAGVSTIAAGLTFLETIANPYTTVLGGEKYATARINMAQTFCGLGLVLGPLVGASFFYSTDAGGNSTGSQTLYIPYVTVAIVVMGLAAVFSLAPMPDLVGNDHNHRDQVDALESSRSIWAHPHFVMAVVAQFFYVAAQAGIFSFFINYMVEEAPPISPRLEQRYAAVVALCPEALSGWMSGWVDEGYDGARRITNKGAASLSAVGAIFFLLGRLAGTGFLKSISGARLLGVYGEINVVASMLVFARLGWLSVASVFAIYFFMSIMFPTIFALGIHGLGSRAKRASAYIVMAILGGALVPKLMGYVAQNSNMSVGFIVPAACFAVIAAYGFLWPALSR